ncbi:MAG TPA: hypothetical protein VHM90_09640 [Phycisphaerae bacterium]|jgi:hypothetical protein|nr:hypothetical protein [Phycisphaerae bacterium]
MYLHFGQKPYGKCDVVPELFYVSTWFFHVDYVPLIPLHSKLVLEQQGSSYSVVDIPFSFKSMLYAWARTALFAALAVLVVVTCVSYSEHERAADAVGPGVGALVCGGLFALVMIYPRKRMPSYARACQLAAHAQLNERGWAALNVLYGRDPLDRPGQAAVDTLSVR